MNRIKFNIIACLCILTLGISCFSSCDNSVATGNPDVVFPTDTTPSFNKHVRPFAQQKCAYAGCHSDTYQAGGRRITDYLSYFETANIGFVIVGNPESSLFYQVMSGKNPHLVNYRIVAPTQNQIDGIKRWIKGGAPNN